MFTGIIEVMGQLLATEVVGGDQRMTFSAPGFFEGSQLGDSIATSGVCLTAVHLTADTFTADLSMETLAATTAAQWRVGRSVNLERALTPAKALGGHIVSGHVDGIGTLVEKAEDARSWRLVFECPGDLKRYVARKGSICIDGVSLTVNEVSASRFGVNIVPHTARHTTLGTLVVGDTVNLEVDVIARYLERLLAEREHA